MELVELQKNLESVRDSIARAAARAGRNPEDVLLLPVTKTLGADVVEQAWQLGIRQVGENKVQEIREKYEVLPKDIAVSYDRPSTAQQSPSGFGQSLSDPFRGQCPLSGGDR